MGKRSVMNATHVGGPPRFVSQILQYCFTFTFNRIPLTIRSVAVVLAASGLLSFFLHLYLSQLGLYLAHPLDKVGSRVLGVAAVSILVLLFWHSIVVSVIVEIVSGRKIPGRSFFGIKKWQWRLYAANLKLVLVTTAYLCCFWAGYSLANKIGIFDFAKVLLGVVFMVPLAWFLIRSWFFLLPVCLEAREDEVLAKSFQASAGYFWSAVAILSSIVAIIIALQGGAEFFLRLFHFIGPLKSGGTIAKDLPQLRAYLGPIVIPMAGGYFFTVLLTTVARIRAYEGIGRRRSSLTPAASR